MTRPIQQAFFSSVTHSTTMMATVTSNTTQLKTSSEDLLQITLKQSGKYYWS